MKNARINVRLNEKTKNKLRATIKSLKKKPGCAHVTESTLIRAIIENITNQALFIEDNHEEKLIEAINQVRRIGVNLNQLAHAHNAGQITRPINADHTLESLYTRINNLSELLLEITNRTLSYQGEIQNRIDTILKQGH